MAQSESCALQSDTLAELESTLNLASEMATIRSCAGASSTVATEFAYQNTVSQNWYISENKYYLGEH